MVYLNYSNPILQFAQKRANPISLNNIYRWMSLFYDIFLDSPSRNSTALHIMVFLTIPNVPLRHDKNKKKQHK